MPKIIRKVEKTDNEHGPYGVEITDHNLYIGIVDQGGFKVRDHIVSLDYGEDYTEKHNIQTMKIAKTIAQAFNVTETSRKTPYQLAEINKDLLSALSELFAFSVIKKQSVIEDPDLFSKVEQAIMKAK